MKKLNKITITVLLVSVLAACGTMTHSIPGVTTTIILTRHGDRDAFSTVLNDKGRRRAEALVKAKSRSWTQ